MPNHHPRITAILPCSNLDSAIHFFARLGFTTPTGEERAQWDGYVVLSHPDGGSENQIHLRELGPDEKGWLEPLKNSFGIYVYSRDVEALGVEFANEVIERVKKPEVKEWGMYEFSINGPDGCLVRVGWPADDIKVAEAVMDDVTE